MFPPFRLIWAIHALNGRVYWCEDNMVGVSHQEARLENHILAQCDSDPSVVWRPVLVAENKGAERSACKGEWPLKLSQSHDRRAVALPGIENALMCFSLIHALRMQGGFAAWLPTKGWLAFPSMKQLKVLDQTHRDALTREDKSSLIRELRKRAVS